MIREIKIRLVTLGKRQIDILAAIRERYREKISPSELSRIINGIQNDNKSQRVLKEIDIILTEWETKKGSEERGH